MASIDDSDGEMHYPDSGDDAIHYEANPFASMVSRAMTPIIERLRSKSRSPRRNSDELSTQDFIIVKSIVLCEDHGISHLQHFVGVATDRNINLSKWVPRVAPKASRCNKADAIAYVNKVLAQSFPEVQDVAHEVAHGDGFPDIGEADDFDINAFVEAARAVDMAGIRAGHLQQQQLGNEDVAVAGSDGNAAEQILEDVDVVAHSGHAVEQDMAGDVGSASNASDTISLQDEAAKKVNAFFNRKLLTTFPGHHLLQVPPLMQREMRQAANKSLDDLLPHIQSRDILDIDSRKVNWWLMEYDLPGDDVMMYYTKLSKQFVRHHDRTIILGITPAITAAGCNKYIALVRKEDHCQIHIDEIKLDGFMPIATYGRKTVPGRPVATCIMNIIANFSGAVSRFVCGMELVAAGMTYTFEHLLESTRCFNDQELMHLFANIALTNKDDRSDLHWSLIKVEKRLTAVRGLAKVPEAIVFQSSMRGKVQPSNAFVSDWASLPVCLSDRSLIGSNNTTLGEWLDNPKLHQNVALLMRGCTRSGKTELSKLLAMLLAIKYQSHGNAHFMFLTTIESAKECKEFMAPGVPIIFDDIDPSDTAQLVHTSVGMWKALLQGANPFTTRARNQDINWCSRQPKIITSNATTVDAWLGKMGITQDRSHVEAIEMRLADCQVPGSLFSNNLLGNDNSLLVPRMSSSEALSAFNGMF